MPRLPSSDEQSIQNRVYTPPIIGREPGSPKVPGSGRKKQSAAEKKINKTENQRNWRNRKAYRELRQKGKGVGLTPKERKKLARLVIDENVVGENKGLGTVRKMLEGVPTIAVEGGK